MVTTSVLLQGVFIHPPQKIPDTRVAEVLKQPRWRSQFVFYWGEKSIPLVNMTLENRHFWMWKSTIPGWWFGCHQFYFPINIGLLIIPIDFHIFKRGGQTTNQQLKEADTQPSQSSLLRVLEAWTTGMVRLPKSVQHRWLAPAGSVHLPPAGTALGW